MRPLISSLLTLPLALGACKWTEFDDLRDEAWVHATGKPDGSKSSNWGVAIVRGKATSPTGGRLAVFGSASSRLNEIEYSDTGGAKQLPEQNLGNIGIGNLSVEPIVLGDPNGEDFALVTQGSAQQVVVAAGGDSNLQQFIINGATAVDAATYVRAPAIDNDEAHGARVTGIQPSQPLIAANDTLFGTFFANPDAPAAFLQPKCQITDGGTSIGIRGLGAVPAGDGTDDIAVWTANGTMLLLDGHLFNGERSGTTTPLCGGGVLDISTSPAVIKASADVGFTPDLGSMSQIIRIDDRFALLQGHTTSTSFLAVWDFEGDTATNTAGVVVGAKIEEPGIRSADLFRDPTGADPSLHVVAGFPSAISDGVTAGKVQVYPVDTAAGFSGEVTELFTDSQPEDGQAFGRSVAVIQYNGLPTISVAGNNEVYTFFRTPVLYNTDRRSGR